MAAYNISCLNLTTGNLALNTAYNISCLNGTIANQTLNATLSPGSKSLAPIAPHGDYCQMRKDGSIYPLFLLCLFAVLENIFTCYIIYANTILRTPTNVFVFSLCIADGLCAGVLLPLAVFCQKSLLYGYLAAIIVFTYGANLSAVTYERLVSITKPLRYQSIVTKRVALRIALMTWVVPICFSLVPLIWNGNLETTAHSVWMIIALAVFLVSPFFFICFVYARISVEVHRLLKSNRHIQVFRFQNKKNKSEHSLGSRLRKDICCSSRHTQGSAGNSREHTPRFSKRDRSLALDSTIMSEVSPTLSRKSNTSFGANFRMMDGLCEIGPDDTFSDDNYGDETRPSQDGDRNSVRPDGDDTEQDKGNERLNGDEIRAGQGVAKPEQNLTDPDHHYSRPDQDYSRPDQNCTGPDRDQTRPDQSCSRPDRFNFERTISKNHSKNLKRQAGIDKDSPGHVTAGSCGVAGQYGNAASREIDFDPSEADNDDNESDSNALLAGDTAQEPSIIKKESSPTIIVDLNANARQSPNSTVAKFTKNGHVNGKTKPLTADDSPDGHVSTPEDPILVNETDRPESFKNRSGKHRRSIFAKMKQQMQSREESCSSYDAGARRRSRAIKLRQILDEVKASTAFAAVAFTYMFTWIPVIYMTFMEAIGKLDQVPLKTITDVNTWTIAVNAAIDPFFYALILRNFRKTIKKHFKRMRCER